MKTGYEEREEEKAVDQFLYGVITGLFIGAGIWFISTLVV